MSAAPEFYTVEELAERWRVHPRTLRRAIKEQRLRATKPAGRWLITPAEKVRYEQATSNVPVVTPKRTRRPQAHARRVPA